ncbi:MAG TPA: recombination mediator RecR [Saprospiraceae bacterium]|nr:recombination protein RecR [Saprospiraceae bacterium]MCB9269704.1 recombination protein RecR [Lewinellaceae bacterium]HPG06587.1 recombination mediator RecR [Saprospiraceae bacterium]HPR01194.1 recombination mediator RecR [Saprospiraceae bacterium]HQU51875.1 recombination mediator RecR [Saprospiraceae bacterium]
MHLPSKLMQQAVDAFATLPGIGRKTALRMVLHLLKQDPELVRRFTDDIRAAREEIRECTKCFNLSDEVVCSICSDPRRDHQVICVVEGIRDVLAIEETHQYRGMYHVLGGVISPIDGIGPENLHIRELVERLQKDQVREVIMAVSPTIEGETTIYYLSKLLLPTGVRVSTIARGVSFGGELEYADEVTLGRSILARVPYSVTED